MRIRHFSRETLPTAAWKNGGGTTQEVASWPAGASLDGFGWRVSIAAIAASGPFSVFVGVDRSIMLLEGDGVRLRSDDGSIDHRLDVPHRPFAFRGDAAVACTMLAGASSDFNVMTRRGRWRAEVDVVQGPASMVAAPHGVVLALNGQWRIGLDGSICREGEGLCWTDMVDAADACDLTPSGPDARLAVVRIVSTGSIAP